MGAVQFSCSHVVGERSVGTAVSSAACTGVVSERRWFSESVVSFRGHRAPLFIRISLLEQPRSRCHHLHHFAPQSFSDMWRLLAIAAAYQVGTGSALTIKGDLPSMVRDCVHLRAPKLPVSFSSLTLCSLCAVQGPLVRATRVVLAPSRCTGERLEVSVDARRKGRGLRHYL